MLFFFFLNMTSSLVFTVYNPVYSAFFLILTFFFSAILIWTFNASFFALIYIIIYVGAIAVLFLFVIMMLDIKVIDSSRFYDFSFVKQIIIFCFFSLLPFSLSIIISYPMLINSSLSIEEVSNNSFDLFFALQAMGQVIYNYYIFCVLLGGLILLIAIIGSIVLTLNFQSASLFKLANKQLARSENFLSFFK